jgi:hypothetical protein
MGMPRCFIESAVFVKHPVILSHSKMKEQEVAEAYSFLVI